MQQSSSSMHLVYHSGSPGALIARTYLTLGRGLPRTVPRLSEELRSMRTSANPGEADGDCSLALGQALDSGPVKTGVRSCASGEGFAILAEATHALAREACGQLESDM